MRYIGQPEKGLHLGEIITAVEAAFREHGLGITQMPPKTYITLHKGDFRTMPAFLPGAGIAGVKVVSVHPENPTQGLPTVMALIILIDTSTGLPDTIMNGTMLTDLRTGAAGAVATRHLCSKKEGVLGVLGAGRQAASLVQAISEVFSVSQLYVSSRSDASQTRFCNLFPDTDCRAVSPQKACDADVIVTATPSRVPVISDEWISPGTHINAVGADAPGKQELDPKILSRSRVFVDDIAQAVHSGEINVPIARGLYSKDEIAGTLGEVVIGITGRKCPDEITVFDSTGLAIQDLAIASLVRNSQKKWDLPFP